VEQYGGALDGSWAQEAGIPRPEPVCQVSVPLEEPEWRQF
jgi:hypothetical protein